MPKYDIRVCAYGTVDEVNSIIGIAQAHLQDEILKKMIARVQNDLFDLGADLCTPHGKERRSGALRITKQQRKRLETEIDYLNGSLESLTSFVFQADFVAAHLHLAHSCASG